MGTWDFDAARKERLRQREPITFTLGGETFECLPVVPLGVSWALVDAPDVAELMQRTRPDILRHLAEMVADMLVPADVDRWWGLFQSKDDLIDDEALYQVVERMTEQYSGRPTSPSTGSSDGRETSGDQSSSTLSTAGSDSSAT